MSKLFTPLIALILVAGSFVSFSTAAHADWGEDNQGLSLALLGRPTIDLINCDDGQLAKWRKSDLTFRINNLDAVDADTLAGVRTGVLSWNNVGGPYKLTEITAGTPDITVNVRMSLNRGSVLGDASGVCRQASIGIERVTIDLGVKSLGRIGARNVTAHETGHALGLGHANREGDVMEAHYNLVVEGLRAVCASNLDAGALRSNTDTYSIGLLSYKAPLLCQ